MGFNLGFKGLNVYIRIDVLIYGCGCISHIFGVLTPGYTHTRM